MSIDNDIRRQRAFSQKIREEKRLGEKTREEEFFLQFIYHENGDFVEVYQSGFNFRFSGELLERMNLVRSSLKK